MNYLRSLSVLALLTSLTLAQTPALKFTPPIDPSAEVLAAPDADAAWKPIALMNNMEHVMGLLGDAKGADREVVVRKIYLSALRSGAAFYQKYPNDPRRWFAVREMAGALKALMNVDGTPKGPIEGVTWDIAAWIEWRKQIDALVVASATAPDAPPEFKLTAEIGAPDGLSARVAVVSKALKAKEPADFAPVKAEFFRLAAKYPTVASVGRFATTYVQLHTQAGATKEKKIAELQDFLTQPNAALRNGAQKEIEKLMLMDRPIDIAFTAADGRKVDLKDYRGKVVLVDFWATWCGPCKAEIPTIKKVYAAYHDKGFEIIGIALENARLSAADTPEQTAAKLETAKKVLMDFTTTTEMPWPQQFDGKFWKNEISTRFEIASIPAMFLIDQEGKLVTTEARGPKLESEVKRLLKL